MSKGSGNKASQIFGNLGSFGRKCIFQVLSAGPLPQHIAFIMDGNRRYAKKWNLMEGTGHRIGYLALMLMLQYCFELGVKYVTVYAFSIENFKRRPEEVQSVMELMLEKIEVLLEEQSMVNQFGVRVYFIGNLELLNKSVRLAAERAMSATACNFKAVLLICVAYTSTDEIVNAVQDSCDEKWIVLKEHSRFGYNLLNQEEFISVTDIEKYMYMAVAPDPDIVIRTSGETRLSNFLLWQTDFCHLYSPSVFWPGIGFRHLFWVVVEFQRNFTYLEKKRKQGVRFSHVDTNCSHS